MPPPHVLQPHALLAVSVPPSSPASSVNPHQSTSECQCGHHANNRFNGLRCLAYRSLLVKSANLCVCCSTTRRQLCSEKPLFVLFCCDFARPALSPTLLLQQLALLRKEAPRLHLLRLAYAASFFRSLCKLELVLSCLLRGLLLCTLIYQDLACDSSFFYACLFARCLNAPLRIVVFAFTCMSMSRDRRIPYCRGVTECCRCASLCLACTAEQFVRSVVRNGSLAVQIRKTERACLNCMAVRMGGGELKASIRRI